jgi:hypothetical protein
MRYDNTHAKQQAFVDSEGDCHCLIHHAKDPKRREDAMELVRSGDPALAMIGIKMLEPCPFREETA